MDPIQPMDWPHSNSFGLQGRMNLICLAYVYLEQIQLKTIISASEKNKGWNHKQWNSGMSNEHGKMVGVKQIKVGELMGEMERE